MRDFKEGDLIMLRGLEFRVRNIYLDPTIHCNDNDCDCVYKNFFENYMCVKHYSTYSALTAWVKAEKIKERELKEV